jgi:hypothetical protein
VISTKLTEAIASLGALFHLFPLLLEELRNLIWKTALPGPRVFKLSLTYAESPRIFQLERGLVGE